MSSHHDLNLLAELYDSPCLSEVSKQGVRRALNEARCERERARVFAEVRVTLCYLFQQGRD